MSETDTEPKAPLGRIYWFHTLQQHYFVYDAKPLKDGSLAVTLASIDPNDTDTPLQGIYHPDTDELTTTVIGIFRTPLA